MARDTQGEQGRRTPWPRPAIAALLVPMAVLLAPAGAGAATSRASNGGVTGTVTAVDGAGHAFTVRTATGSVVSVKVIATTAYKDSSVKVAAFDDVKVGRSVAVIGSSAHGIDTAVIVIIGGSGSGPAAPGAGFGAPGRFRPGVVGKVTSVDAAKHTFVVKAATGSVTVQVSSSTTYRDRGAPGTSFSAVKVGSEVAVIGTRSGRVERATAVLIGFAVPAGARG